MPIYEYECPKCGRFELLEMPGENPNGDPVPCNKNGCKEMAVRVISRAAFHLKGSGWYKTDYSSSANGTGSSNGAERHKDSDKPKKEASSKTECSAEGNSKSSASCCEGGCSCK